VKDTDDTRPAGPDCCGHAPDPRIARYFDAAAGRSGDTNDLPPAKRVSVALLAELRDVDEIRPTVLELGCGMGALSVSLVERGASRATGIDLSPGSIEVATRRAARAGLEAQTAFAVGDGATATLTPHDWVVLDRMICCYRHAGRLLENAIPAARRRIAFSIPESRGGRGIVNRPLWFAENVINFAMRPYCPGYVHDIRVIEDRLHRAGFSRLRSGHSRLWYLAVFERR
jgi:magnesium-protoporphyrin O-methyltransferase